MRASIVVAILCLAAEVALSDALPLPLPASKYALYPVASICNAQNLSIFADLSVPVRARIGFGNQNGGSLMCQCLGLTPCIIYKKNRSPRQARPSPRAASSTSRRQCQASEAQQCDGPSHPCTSLGPGRTINNRNRPTCYRTRPPVQPCSPRPIPLCSS